MKRISATSVAERYRNTVDILDNPMDRLLTQNWAPGSLWRL